MREIKKLMGRDAVDASFAETSPAIPGGLGGKANPRPLEELTFSFWCTWEFFRMQIQFIWLDE